VGGGCIGHPSRLSTAGGNKTPDVCNTSLDEVVPGELLSGEEGRHGFCRFCRFCRASRGRGRVGKVRSAGLLAKLACRLSSSKSLDSNSILQRNDSEMQSPVRLASWRGLQTPLKPCSEVELSCNAAGLQGSTFVFSAILWFCKRKSHCPFLSTFCFCRVLTSSFFKTALACTHSTNFKSAFTYYLPWHATAPI